MSVFAELFNYNINLHHSECFVNIPELELESLTTKLSVKIQIAFLDKNFCILFDKAPLKLRTQ